MERIKKIAKWLRPKDFAINFAWGFGLIMLAGMVHPTWRAIVWKFLSNEVILGILLAGLIATATQSYWAIAANRRADKADERRKDRLMKVLGMETRSVYGGIVSCLSVLTEHAKIAKENSAHPESEPTPLPELKEYQALLVQSNWYEKASLADFTFLKDDVANTQIDFHGTATRLYALINNPIFTAARFVQLLETVKGAGQIAAKEMDLDLSEMDNLAEKGPEDYPPDPDGT